MSNFTKGKWKYLHNLYQVVSYPENEPVFYDGNAQALWHDITGELNIGLNNSEEEAHANGRLIAAAPEMYELLKFFCEDKAIDEDRFDDYLAAIFEAKKLFKSIDGDIQEAQ